MNKHNVTYPQVIRFKLYCKTCNTHLQYDPEGFSSPIGEPDKQGERILDLSWHFCDCTATLDPYADSQYGQDIYDEALAKREWVFEIE